MTHADLEHLSELEAGVAAQLHLGGWHDNAERHEKVAHDCDEALAIRELTNHYGETRQ